MKVPTTVYVADDSSTARIVQPEEIPAAAQADLAEYGQAYTPDGGEYFHAKHWKVYFQSCDGFYTKTVTTPAAAAAKVREYVGASDEDFGYVSEDGISRCDGVKVFHQHSKYGHEISLRALLRAYPA
jgi:hypothetical protein